MSYENAESSDLNRLSKTDVKPSSDLIEVDDDILNELENDDVAARYREARLNELIMKAKEKQLLQQHNNSSYKEISEEEFLNLTTKNKKCLVHFFHPDFRRCDIMNTHLQKLAVKYHDVCFAKINVEKAKFFVKKLNVQMLPAVLFFVDGILKNRIVGFDQMGNSDSFQTKELEKKMWKMGFVKKPEDEDNESGSDEEAEKKRGSKLRQINNNSDSD